MGLSLRNMFVYATQGREEALGRELMEALQKRKSWSNPQQSKLKILKLIQKGARLNGMDFSTAVKHFPPLSMAAFFGETDIVKEMLKYGADIHAKNLINHTALHNVFTSRSSIEMKLKTIKILERHGADTSNVYTNNKELIMHLNKFEGAAGIADDGMPFVNFLKDIEKIKTQKLLQRREKILRDIDQGTKEPMPRKYFGGFKRQV